MHTCALIAYADDNTIDKLASYGRSIGLAFQLIDDLNRGQ